MTGVRYLVLVDQAIQNDFTPSLRWFCRVAIFGNRHKGRPCPNVPRPIQSHILQTTRFDGQGLLWLPTWQDAAVKESHTTGLAEITLGCVSSICRSSPDAQLRSYMLWERPYTFRGEERGGAKGRSGLFAALEAVADVYFLGDWS